MEAGEIKASVRIEKSGASYQLTLTGTRVDSQTKRTVVLIDNKKKRVSPSEYASFTVSDLKKKLLVGPFLHTLPGGLFHDTMSKRSVNDNEKLEAIGMKGHDTFVREYDISFQYDPALLTGVALPASEPTPTPTPAVTTSSGGPSSQSRGASSSEGNFIMKLTLTKDASDIILKAKGQSPLYNPEQIIVLKQKEFSELRVSDFFLKLNDMWPKFDRSGSIMNANGRVDPFTTRTKLESLGLEAVENTKKKYQLRLEVDNSQPLPKPSAPRKAPTPQQPEGRKVEPRQPEVRSAEPRTISISSDYYREAQSQEPSTPKEEVLGVEIEIVPLTYRINIKSSAGNGHIDVSEADLAISVDELLKKTGVNWRESRKEGQLLTGGGKKVISSGDSLQRLGLKGTAQNVQLAFSVPVKTVPATSTRQIAPEKQHKIGTFDQMKLEVRVFQDNAICFINLRGQTKDWKGDMEITIKKADYERMNIHELIGKFGKRWPAVEPEGWLQTVSGPVPFTARSVLTEVGIVVDPQETLSYQLIFPTAPEGQGEAHPAPAASLKRPVVDHHAPGNKTGISEGTVGVNVRMFYDNGLYNLQINGAGGDWRGQTDVVFKKADYPNVTFGDLKKKLRKWPQLSSAGKFHTPSGNKLFSDNDRVVDLGLIAGEDGSPSVHQFSWELE